MMGGVISTNPFDTGRFRTYTCTVEGCDKEPKAKGLCINHYQSQYAATSDGSMTGRPKLTREDCRQVRLRKAGFATFQEIAREFQVSINVIRRVLRREYVPLEDFMEAREGKG